MFIPDKPFQPSAMQHFSLLDPFVSYEKQSVVNTAAGNAVEKMKQGALTEGEGSLQLTSLY